MTEEQLKEAIDAALAPVLADNARLRESLLAREARDLVRDALGKSHLPQVTQTRLLVRLAANPPLKEGALDNAALLERVKEGVDEESAYLNSVRVHEAGTGRVEGMGISEAAGATSGAQTQEATTKALTESFMALGLSEASAQVAARSGW